VSEIFDVGEAPNQQFALSARQVAVPYLKDYDAVSDRPTEWSQRFDISKWAFFAAFAAGQRVGGVAIAYDTPDLDMLEGRIDLAVLWDIRVDRPHRRRGVGTALVAAAASWAFRNGCRQLKVETQNTNVAACRFYTREGFVVRSARHGVYSEQPAEIQLLWYKDIQSAIGAA
jgi:GNAT superfamily N-acetyltransferase